MCYTHKWYECTYCYDDFYIESGKSIHSIELSYHSTFHGEKTIDHLIYFACSIVTPVNSIQLVMSLFVGCLPILCPFCRPRGPEVPAQWATPSLWQVVLHWSTVTSSYWNSQVHSKWHSHSGWVFARNVDCLVEADQPSSHLEQSHQSSWESSCGGEAPSPTTER